MRRVFVVAAVGGILLALPLFAASGEAAKAAAAKTDLVPFLMPGDFDDLDLVAWRVEQGRPDSHNPLLEPEMPWEQGGIMSHGTVLRDPIDGLWKAWQVSTPLSKAFGPGTWTHDRRLTYLESDDGVHWRRPLLSFVPLGEHKQTNILMDLWCSYASVNIDPQRDRPYELFIFRDPNYPGSSGIIPGLPLPPGKDKHAYGLYRFRSKDGKSWEPMAGPLRLNTSDSCFIYPAGDAGYVAYHKTELPAFPGGLAPYDIADGGLRLIGRRTSRDGVQWSDPTALVLTPDWRDPGDTQFMELCPLAMPGGYVATATVYHNHTQSIDLQWAASRDGITWWRPDRRPALPNPSLGEYGGGMIWAMRTPVLEGERLHVYYAGVEGLHGDMHNTQKSGPRRLQAGGEPLSRQSSSLPDFGALCRATWTADRLWALAPAAGGPFVGTALTKNADRGAKRLLVNAITRPGGALRVELLDQAGGVLPGFSAADCEPVTGDEHAGMVRWKGGDRAPANTSRARFHLARAFLYGFDWRE